MAPEAVALVLITFVGATVNGALAYGAKSTRRLRLCVKS